MGRQVECHARSGALAGRGTALLESTEIVFRGAFRLRIALRDVRKLTARDGELTVAWPDGEATFELGAQAEKWVAAIENPRGLMDKLGVKAGARVLALGLGDGALDASALLDDLRARATLAHDAARARECDVVFVGLESKLALPRLTEGRAAIYDAGAVWAVWRKGRAELREDDVRAFARDHGLVDVKVASISDSLSGLKLVIPVADRANKAAAARAPRPRR